LARLRVPRLEEEVFVLAGSQGRTLAFGPGHVAGSAEPGAFGNAVVGGHRDTHFAFLRDLRIGDDIDIETGAFETGERKTVRYRVADLLVVDERETSLLEDFSDRRLTLVTCYPFEAVIPGGPLRYVVIAVADSA